MNLRSAIISISILAGCLWVSASEPTLIEKADSAYAADRFAESADLYTKAIAEEGVSAPLLYNLGNAMYRLGKPGQAILNYERALRLDPTFDDARSNLEFVNSRITDRAGERGTFIGNALDSAANNASSDTWAWIAFAAFVITCALVGVYMFTSEVRVRKTGFFGALAMLAVTVATLFLSHRAARIATDSSAAIIIRPSTILSTSPRQPRSRSEEAMLLHEGTKVTILDSVKAVADSIPSVWYDVEVDNTHRAWVNAAHVEKVH